MPWVEISQAAFMLGVTERTIRTWIKSGKLHARSVNGRREVEIPDPDDEDASRIFEDEGEEEPSSLNTQKRLEVALLECGRVKGTLASQERIMENLSSNIAELNAKLQQREGAVWQRTLMAAVILFLGVIAVLWISRSHQSELSQTQKQLSEEYIHNLESTTSTHAEKLTKLFHEKDEAVQEAEKRFNALLAEQVNQTKTEADKIMQQRVEDFKQMLDTLSARNDKLQTELDTIRADKIKAETSRSMLEAELQETRKRLADAAKEAEIYKARMEEAEKARRELEATETRLRRQLMGEKVSDE